jgi:hypothetical protein
MAKSKAGIRDEFSAIVYQTVTESAANTLTYAQIQTGYGSLQKTAWIIHRLEYYIPANVLNFIGAADDVLQIALVTSNLLTTLSLAEASVVDLFHLEQLSATQVGFQFLPQPLIRDFSALPGGGKLVLPYPLWLAAKGTSLGSAATVAIRLFFTERDLADADWMELVQQTRLLS